VNAESGSKTTLSSFIAVAVVVLALLVLTPVLYYLPLNVLAAVILVAVFNLVDYPEVQYLWKVSKFDLLMWLIAFFVTLGLDIEDGVVVSVATSITLVIWRSYRSSLSVMVRSKMKQKPHQPNSLVRFFSFQNRDECLVRIFIKK
jgi:SulP family sulfate permease